MRHTSVSLHLHRTGNRVERFFNKVEQWRHVATRHDRLAANNLAFIQLASDDSCA
jgi:transposase